MRAGYPVTVLLPVRNGMPHLPEAIESVLAQTHRDFELLVLDDGSTDGTPEYLGSVHDPRLRVVSLDGVGLVAALNRGLAEARHEVVARMDADDVSYPARLALQVADLAKHPNVLAVGCCYTIIDESGVVTREQHVTSVASYAERQLYFRDAFAHASMTFRRQAVIDVGGYRDIGPCEDYDLWLRLLSHGAVTGVCAPPLFTYRVVATGVSQTKAAAQDDCRKRLRAGAHEARPISVPSPWTIASEGHAHVLLGRACRLPAGAYAFDHLGLAVVAARAGNWRAAWRCGLGLVMFLIRHPSGARALPPLAWWTASSTTGHPLTTEQVAARELGRPRRRGLSDPMPREQADDFFGRHDE